MQIHHVESEQWLGGLLNANDQLVHALMSFEQMDRSIDADSDSDDEIAEQAHMYRSMCHTSSRSHSNDLANDLPVTVAQMKGKEAQQTADNLAGLSLDDSKDSASPPPPPPPPRPAMQRQDSEEDEDDDEENPFGDSNVIETPATEKAQPRW